MRRPGSCRFSGTFRPTRPLHSAGSLGAGRRSCVESSATSASVRRRISCSAGSSGSSSAATTRPASRFPRPAGSSTSARSATSRTSSRSPARTARTRPRGSATPAGRPTARSPSRTPTRSPAATRRNSRSSLNGIVENYRELKAELEARRPQFSSADRRRGRRAPARDRPTRATSPRPCAPSTRGSRATSPSSSSTTTIPDMLVGVRCETPLVIGLGKDENFLASNLGAFLSETRSVQFPGNGQVVEITPRRRARRRRRATAAPVELEVVEIDWDVEVAERSRLRDLHGEGDLRAARRASARRSATASVTATSCSRGSA